MIFRGKKAGVEYFAFYPANYAVCRIIDLNWIANSFLCTNL